MKNVYYVGSGELTFDLIERIINENLKLELAPEAKERIQKCRDYLDKKTAESAEPLYGITTGFGSLCSKSISPDELGTLQENLIKSHACSVGEEIRPVIIKLMTLLKANALSSGHSGVQCARMSSRAAFPVDGVCAFGSALTQQMVKCSSFSSSSHSVRRNGARRPASTRRPASANVVQ